MPALGDVAGDLGRGVASKHPQGVASARREVSPRLLIEGGPDGETRFPGDPRARPGKLFGPRRGSGVREPRSCGDTITTDTKLHRDLVNCPNNGIVIGANNITLDLNGHLIDGDGTPFPGCRQNDFCDTGVENSAGHDGVRIEGGKLREFALGVVVFRARDSRLRDLSSSRNSDVGVFIGESTDSRIEKSSFVNSAGSGIVLIDSPDNSIERNSVARSGLSGVYLSGCDHSRIDRNVVRGSGAVGLEVLESSRSRVAKNRFSDNPEGAMIVEGNRNQISRNLAFRNADIIVAGNRNAITRNHLSDSHVGAHGGGFGISFEGGHDNLIARNLVTDTGKAGIRLAGLAGPAVDTVVRRNRLRDASQDGVLVGGEAPAAQTLLARNHVVGSEDDGIDVESRTTTLTRNHADHNGDLGIEAVVGVTDGGGNRAHGNGDPRQCTNVACN